MAKMIYGLKSLTIADSEVRMPQVYKYMAGIKQACSQVEVCRAKWTNRGARFLFSLWHFGWYKLFWPQHNL